MVDQDGLQELMATGLKTYFHDPFLSTEQITQAVTQTGAITTNICQLKLDTGVQEGSTARANYAYQFFNPLYSKLYVKARLNSMADAFMFAGFTTSLAAPTWQMTTSHAGFMLKDDVLYFSTGNGDPSAPNFQVTPIGNVDMTRWLTYKIDGYNFSWYSLPYTVPYFDKNVLPGLKQGMFRKWSKVYSNGSVLPDDTMHYLVFYITNGTNASKYLEVQKVNYAEVYPD